MGKRKTIVLAVIVGIVALAAGAAGGLVLGIAGQRKQVETLSSEVARLTNQNDQLTKDVQGLNEAVKTRDERYRQAAADLAKARSDAQTKQEELTAQNTDLKDQLDQRTVELQRAQEAVTKERQSHADAQAEMRGTIDKLNKELQELKAKAAP